MKIKKYFVFFATTNTGCYLFVCFFFTSLVIEELKCRLIASRTNVSLLKHLKTQKELPKTYNVGPPGYFFSIILFMTLLKQLNAMNQWTILAFCHHSRCRTRNPIRSLRKHTKCSKFTNTTIFLSRDSKINDKSCTKLQQLKYYCSLPTTFFILVFTRYLKKILLTFRI